MLEGGRKLWQRLLATSFPNRIKLEYKVGRVDAGWYEVRRALEAYGDVELSDFEPFRAAYIALSEQLCLKLHEWCFLPA